MLKGYRNIGLIMATDYFFISDLHIGGDGLLNHCDFEEELIGFLQELENYSGKAELVIIGDAFGLWEFTELKGVDKVTHLIETHQPLFQQFLKTSHNIDITLIPGNHDYELACYPEFIPILKAYGIQLEPKEYITREIAGRKIWIEHGNQHDGFNSFEQYGDPASTPVGYYITSQFVGGAGNLSKKGRDAWLKDIQAVYPTEHIPHWVFSNYFYREMSPILRYFLVPFLLLFTASLIVVALSVFEHKGILPTQIAQLSILRQIGGIGKLLEWVILANSTVISFLLILAIPMFFLVRDIKNTLARYNLIGLEDAVAVKDDCYQRAAQKVFEQQPDMCVFIYGHTHHASLLVENERAIINTGTWIKMLNRVPARARFMPDIYAPSYCLSIFKIYEVDGKIMIEYRSIDKQPKEELTLLQRLLTFRRRPHPKSDIARLTQLNS